MDDGYFDSSSMFEFYKFETLFIYLTLHYNFCTEPTYITRKYLIDHTVSISTETCLPLIRPQISHQRHMCNRSPACMM